MPEPLRQQVFRRGKQRCEYCQMPREYDSLPFQLDHVIAEKHGGTTESENLALSCYNCNAHKGPNIAGRDPLTSLLTPLFNPRRDAWNEHFEWIGGKLSGRTPVGRVTVDVLNINDSDRIDLRRILMAAGLFHVTAASEESK